MLYTKVVLRAETNPQAFPFLQTNVTKTKILTKSPNKTKSSVSDCTGSVKPGERLNMEDSSLFSPLEDDVVPPINPTEQVGWAASGWRCPVMRPSFSPP